MAGFLPTSKLHRIIVLLVYACQHNHCIIIKQKQAQLKQATQASNDTRNILSTSTSSSKLNALLSVTLEKPLRLLLEAMKEGAAMGVRVQKLVEGGSANKSYYDLVGLKVASVMGESVVTSIFDTVMKKISMHRRQLLLNLRLTTKWKWKQNQCLQLANLSPSRSLHEGKLDMEITNAKVGDNLRKTLLKNDVELYRGMKKKFGNCGGGGQCSFCAIEMTDTTEG